MAFFESALRQVRRPLSPLAGGDCFSLVVLECRACVRACTWPARPHRGAASPTPPSPRLLADVPHSDMCVPAHLFRAHYCQACVNKYPGVARSSVPVLHHRRALSLPAAPSSPCSSSDSSHDYTVSTVVIHLLPKLRRRTPSLQSAARGGGRE